ncbi:MAG: hypothetical protein ACI89J_004312 [Hyphomicrobiaceae bacterium]|jgi:hypothetical protein
MHAYSPLRQAITIVTVAIILRRIHLLRAALGGFPAERAAISWRIRAGAGLLLQ